MFDNPHEQIAIRPQMVHNDRNVPLMEMTGHWRNFEQLRPVRNIIIYN
jgi:hypothetical protein